ncbi:hypothetical protein scyTo_0011592 [Scyliorhinus torazame]|uniref:Uncharacterized protein n=1 Tax=Scyliorhinus torazame TaxID=75743 RepID=A0A401NR24_SCYTO|nr:hypothetical protein [Scyliorhinus torazame]
MPFSVACMDMDPCSFRGANHRHGWKGYGLKDPTHPHKGDSYRVLLWLDVKSRESQRAAERERERAALSAALQVPGR